MKTLVPILLALALPALAQEEEAIEEIVVTGDTPIPELRLELRRVDARLYTEFNRLNDKDEYDIYCRKHRPIGTQILQRQCKAKMFWEAVEAGTDPDTMWIVREVPRARFHERALREKMLALAKESAELRGILAERKALLDAIDERKNRD